MVWTAWNNGRQSATGAGYGFKIEVADRDRYFNREWRSVTIELPSENGHRRVVVGIDKDSFWDVTFCELISRDIGLWLLAQQVVPWPHRRPPQFEIESKGDGRFRIKSK